MENAALVGAVVNVVGLAIALAVGIPWLRNAIDASQTRIYDLPPNNDEVAEQDCLDLLRAANSSIVMYDDGDTDKGSPVGSARHADTVRSA